jgi:phosphatidylinositol alpha-1,6-mannosyltransferase
MAKPSLRVLALVTDAFGGHGGIAQYNRDFLTSLTTCEGVDNLIVLPREGAPSPGMLPTGVRQLGPVKGRLAYSLAALRVAQAHRPIDIVFCGHLFMTPLAAAIARFLHASLWVQVHGVDAWEELSSPYRRSVETAALVTSVSRYTRQRLLQWVGLDPARVKVLPNTVDSRFQPGPKPDYLLERYAACGRKVLMTVSRLASSEQYKGHDRVIRALPRVLLEHPGAIYIIVGDGDDCPRIKAVAEECGVADKVRFAGRVAPEELPEYYRLADVFVMPSTGEGFGIAFLEAMASGTPVIGGNKDGSLDPLGDGALGTAIDPEDAGALASAICVALRTPAGLPEGAGRFSQSAFSAHVRDLVWSLFLPTAQRRSHRIGVV